MASYPSTPRRERRPKGMINVTPRMREAFELIRIKGRPALEVAAKYHVTVTSVSRWCQLIDEAEADARHRAAGP